MAVKRAVVGLRGVALSPVVTNTALAYVSDVAMDLPFAGSMNITANERTQDIYYDDTLYASVKEAAGEHIEIRLGEISFETLEELGLGEYDKVTGVFREDFCPPPGTYSLRAISDTIGRLPYYLKWHAFELTGVRYDNYATKGDGISVCEVIVTGSALKPRYPGMMPKERMRLEEGGANQADCDAFMSEGDAYPYV